MRANGAGGRYRTAIPLPSKARARPSGNDSCFRLFRFEREKAERVAADTPYTRTLKRAIGVLGSEEQLARTLGVTTAQLQAWLRGEGTPPVSVYTAALDIVANGRVPRSPDDTKEG